MKTEISKFLEQADDFLEDAEYLLLGDRYKGVANRSYYTMFACAQALLFYKGEFSKTHSGVSSKFYHLYIKPNIFARKYGKMLTRTFQKRQSSDYDADAHISRDEAEEIFNDATDFLATTKKYLNNQFLENLDFDS